MGEAFGKLVLPPEGKDKLPRLSPNYGKHSGTEGGAFHPWRRVTESAIGEGEAPLGEVLRGEARKTRASLGPVQGQRCRPPGTRTQKVR